MYDRLASLYDTIYSFKDYAAEAARLHELIQARRPGARTLLDVACGTGKHLEQLRQHYEVEGADYSAAVLEIARKRLPDTPLHQADMRELRLGKTYDAVTCLFSAIGHMTTVEDLDVSIARMAGHLSAAGVLIVEPWIPPERYEIGRLFTLVAREPDVQIARMNISEREGDLAILDFHFLIGTNEGIEYTRDRHVLGLFGDADYENAFRRAGLAVEHDPEGLIGRGLYIGTRGDTGAATSRST
jgi:dTDP-3-amino-3,4,6-trideoxy-alpha-D-glucopyranose N,N-dimethyltransferase